MADPAHVLIVASTYYEEIGQELIAGATAAIEMAGCTLELIDVPGAFEIPAVISFADRSPTRSFDGYVALGCVIRGETTHYDYVCGESARGLQDLAVQRGLAIGYGIVTVENRDQAWSRAAVGERNKGGGAAEAALSMVAFQRHFGTTS